MQSKSKNNLLAIFVVLLFATPILFSCGGGTKQDTEVYEDPELAEFAEFYDRFHKDPEYQLEHITFPLEGLPGMADSMMVEGSTFYYKKPGWKILKHVDWDTISGYNRRIEPTGLGIINEYICTDDYFCMSRRFAKLHDGWFLIYYADFNYRPNLRQ